MRASRVFYENLPTAVALLALIGAASVYLATLVDLFHPQARLPKEATVCD